MNILQKFANSNNSLPRNMELFMFDIKEELERICNCKIDLLRLHKNLRSLISQRIARDGIYA